MALIRTSPIYELKGKQPFQLKLPYFNSQFRCLIARKANHGRNRSDPVAIDKACYDMAKQKGKTFKGYKTFAYAESIGLGSADYTLHEL
ncbi:MAG: hypothetical protein PHY48_08105 [Candidatus Cloacimonetes bacterium]|nr:hypothetical protein [Candidatus Cloacimonadota bacterium]